LAPSLKLYPAGPRIRDAPQLALLGRFEALLAPSLQMRREVTLPIAGDQRAWDARVTDGRRSASVEGETKIGDAQALERRLALKIRDEEGWAPAQRDRPVSAALRAYAALALSADRGAARHVD